MSWLGQTEILRDKANFKHPHHTQHTHLHPTKLPNTMRQGSSTSPQGLRQRRPLLGGAGFAITLPGVRIAHTTKDLACFMLGRGRIDLPFFRGC